MRTDYGAFTVEPLTPHIGAEVVDVDLAEVDDELAAVIHEAWMDWKVLFFRDQRLTRPEHIAFGRRFGVLERHPFLADRDDPEILVLESTADRPSSADNWHSDVTFAECPPMGSILRAIVVPPVGGDTLWANMERAYEELRDDLKERIEGRVAVHDFVKPFGRGISEEERERRLAEYPPQVHPVVRTHPVTGRRSLFVNGTFTSHIEGMERDESTQLLRRLYDRAKQPEYQVRFRWRPDSVAMWDNRCTQHYAAPDFYPEHRRMERVTLSGDRPV
jgi:taurine dioxygenase